MITGIDGSEQLEYVSSKDTSENKTVFVIGVISNKHKLNIMSSMTTIDGKPDVKAVQTQSLELFKVGVKEIRGLINKKTKQAETIKHISDDTLERIPIDVLTEVAAKVLQFNFLSGEEAKN
jgi:hypothetical protein